MLTVVLLALLALLLAGAATIALWIIGGSPKRLNQLNGLQRVTVLLIVLALVGGFFVFLGVGKPSISDSTSATGDAGAAWLRQQRSEWWWRCIPGTWTPVNNIYSGASFSCYSIGVDGFPAALRAGSLALAIAAAARIAHWVREGFSIKQH
jgi:hypothetical protein